MKRKILVTLFTLTLVVGASLIMAAPALANGGTHYYVDDDWQTGDPPYAEDTDGDIYFATIQAAINTAEYDDTVEVAAGTYVENITLKNGVDVLGAGDDVTTIDGGGSGTVVTANSAGLTFDGFTVTNGNTSLGGGMHNTYCSSLTVSNCTFYDNYASYGGGIYNEVCGSLTFTGCTFERNTALYYGGGLANWLASATATITDCDFNQNTAYTDYSHSYGGGLCNYSSDATVTGCTFYNNSASSFYYDGYGGGAYNRNTAATTFTDCTFTENEASTDGGGMYNHESASPIVVNCVFDTNTANTRGGGICTVGSSSPLVTNCTFTGNTAGTCGGGICNVSSASPVVLNCILWNDSPDEICNDNAAASVNYCDVEGGYTGTDNIDADPLFADAANGDLHIVFGSPCIDTGDNASATGAGLTTDYEGDDRILDGTGDLNAVVDMGADEYVLSAPDEVWVDDDWAGSSTGDEVETGKYFGYNAFAVIQDGIDAAASPGTVNVAAGTYHENNIALRDGVDVLGAGAGNSVIDADANGRVLKALDVSSATTLDGFTITDGGSATHGAGIYLNNSSPVISNCIFDSNSAGYGGGMCNLNSSSPTVTNCSFSNNYSSFGGGIYNDNASPTVTNCTFYGNHASGDGGGMYNDNSSSPIVTNCIFWGDTNDEICDDISNPSVTYCNVQGGYDDPDIDPDYNINSDPLFDGGATEDFYLSSGSPCIDVGYNDAVPAWLITDFGGDPRILDGDGNLTFIVDMGADEYAPTPDEVWVDDDWAGTADGTEVETDKYFGYNAFAVIQDGIDAVSGSTVHVLAGTYYENITLVDGVDVLGAGDDVTFIDGSSSGTVVYADTITSATTFDGFTIQNGSGYYDGHYTYGGGMYIIDSSSALTVSNCTFTGNSADSGGGGMCNYCSDPTLENCTFYGNESTYGGGGMCNYYSDPTLTGCTFTSNCNLITHNVGGGMYNYHSDPILTNCTFTSNSATYNVGGGMYNDQSSPTVTNCAFTDNTATNGSGGGMYNDESSPTVTNCTFTGNTASNYGGGMYNSNCSASFPVITNCILWGNSPDEIYNLSSTPTVTYSDVQGGYTGTGNIDADPLFVDAANGDLHIIVGSPCVDTGDDAAATAAGLTTDYEGEPRFIDGNGDSTATVDMGADECLAEVWVDDDWQTGGEPYAEDTDGDEYFATVTAAVEAVAYGGTVHIYQGTYNEEDVITITDKSMTIESVSGDWHNVIIDPTSWETCVFNLTGEGSGPFDGDVTFSNITLIDSHKSIYLSNGLSAGSTITFDGCCMRENGTGIDADDNLYGDIFVNDCIISDNQMTTTGISLYNVYGTVEITDSVIGGYWDAATSTSYAGNASDGIYIYEIEETGEVLIDNNIIADNESCGISANYCYGQLTITGNIISGYDYDLTSEDGYYGGNGAEGIYIYEVEEDGFVNIERNRIAENSSYGICFYSYVYGQAVIDSNCIGAWTGYFIGGELFSRDYLGNEYEGIYVNYEVDYSGSLTIINNGIAENGYSGVYIYESYGDVVISANHIGAWTQEIPGYDPVSHAGNYGAGIYFNYLEEGGLLIHGNTIDSNQLLGEDSGIHLEYADSNTEVDIDLNNILNNDGYGVYYSGDYVSYLDAEYNWWGDASGPGGEGTGSGDEVSSYVDYYPWLAVTVENALAGVITNGTLDNTAGTDTEVVVTGSATVTSAGYSGDPSGTGFSGDIGKYIDVHIDDDSDVTELQIRLYYTDDEITGLDESSLVLYWWDGADWAACSDSGVNTADVDSYSGYIWANITDATTPSLADLTGTAFGGYGIEPSSGTPTTGGDTTVPYIFDVAECDEGVTDTTADICWTTTEPATSQVKFWASPINYSTLYTSYVRDHHVQLTGLTPNTTYFYQTISKDRAGNVAISSIHTFTTLPSPAAAFTVTDLVISPATVASGHAVTISVTVTNTGNLAGSYTVALKINGVTQATREVNLDEGEDETVSFTVTKEAAGSYSVEVDGLSGSFSVTAASSAPTSSATSSSSTASASPPTEGVLTNEDSSSDWPWIIGIVGGVVVIGLVTFFLSRRLRR